jgi:hypothetical protein
MDQKVIRPAELGDRPSDLPGDPLGPLGQDLGNPLEIEVLQDHEPPVGRSSDEDQAVAAGLKEPQLIDHFSPLAEVVYRRWG